MNPIALRNLTRRFPSMLGLRLVPIGLWFLVLGSVGLEANGRLPLTLAAALLAPVVWLTLLVHRRYRQCFGTVEPSRLVCRRAWPLTIFVVASPLLLQGVFTSDDPLQPLATFVTSIFLAAVALVFPPSLSRDLRGWRATLLLGALAGGAWLYFVSSDPARLNSVAALFCLLLGGLLLAAGCLEHTLFSRILGPLSGRESVGETV